MRRAPPGLALAAILGCSNGAAPATSGDAGPTDAASPDAASPDAACGAGITPGPGVVVTDRGAVRGAVAGGAWAYKGIPYAAPPVGPLRWRPPADVACWPGERDATAFGPACMQLDATGAPEGAEDCLTLNVWTPSSPPASPLPVLFFVHGGGNVQGSSSEQPRPGDFLYDGRHIAERGPAVVVTINYRLAALGFVAHPALSAESPDHVSGNYGIHDQIAALRWVQRNIAAFGGDPARVLLFGESAGARDTCVLLASPLAAGLFSRALMQSGGCVEPTLAEVETAGARYVTAAGCAAATDIPACLRALTPQAATLAIPGTASVTGSRNAYPYGANIDGVLLTGNVMATLTAGRHNHVPFIIGANRDETQRAVPMITTDMQYRDAIHAQFGIPLGDRVLAEYPSASYPTPRAALVAVTSDARFICPSRRIARAVAASQSPPVRRYFFTHTLDTGMAGALGAYHGLELVFVFRQLTIAGYMPSPAEEALADAMIAYWTRFASTGDPNGASAPTWPLYASATDAHIILDDPLTAANGVRTAQCDFWDTVSPP